MYVQVSANGCPYHLCSCTKDNANLRVQNIAATALFLATKAEEHNRKTKDVIIAVARTAQKNPSMIIDEQSKEFWKWKDSILAYEETMLELLCFDVLLPQSPHKVVVNFLGHMGWLPSQKEPNRKVRDLCWAFVNDAIMSVSCLLIQPEEIGVASIFFALKFAKMVMPDDDGGQPWWERYGGTVEGVTTVVKVMKAFYADNPLRKPEVPFVGTVETTLDDLERSRLRNGDFTPKSDNTVVKDESPNRRTGQESSQPPVEAMHDANNEGIGKTERKLSQGAPPSLVVANNNEPGDSDAVLKEAANDPATHELVSSTQATTNAMKRPARIDSADSGASPSKRAKVVSPRYYDDNAEVSEEGEV